MEVKEKNYKSDILLSLHLTLGGKVMAVPEHDFILRFYSGTRMRHYDVGRKNGELFHAKIDESDNTLLYCYIKNHGLQPGELQCEYVDLAPVEGFEDGIQRTYSVTLMETIELVEDNGDDTAMVDASAAIDLNGVIADARGAATRANAISSDLEAKRAADYWRGATGATGPQGPAGRDGTNGQDGADGADGADGVGIASVVQTTTSHVSEGENIVTVTLTNGNSSTFSVFNGEQGQGGEQADWNETDTDDPSYIKNKPTIPAAQVQSDWTEADNTKVDYIKNKPTLATVATSGSYNDLSNKPTIPDLSTYCPIILDTRNDVLATITGVAPFASLDDGQRILLRLAYNTASSTKLQLTLSGGTDTLDYPVYIQNYNSITQLGAAMARANSYLELVFDNANSRWVMIGYKDNNSTYNIVAQSELNTGTNTDARTVTAKLLRDNFPLIRAVKSETVSSGSVTIALDATKYHVCDDEVDDITLTLPASDTRADEFIVTFTAESSSCSVTLPRGVTLADNFDWSEAAAGVVFQVSICDGIAAYLCLTPQNP